MSRLVQNSASKSFIFMPRSSVHRVHMRSTWAWSKTCMSRNEDLHGYLCVGTPPPTSRVPFGVVAVRMELDLSFVAAIAPR